jgi:hypothetical protein
MERQNDRLDFIIVIYKVDRKKKISEIRKIIHIPDKEIKNSNNFSVVQSNRYCNILINNHNIYNSVTLREPIRISFKEDIQRILLDNSLQI